MFSIYLIILLAVLAAWKKTRRFAFYFLPWFLFGIIYDSMRLYPNYMVNDIDVANLYHAEKSLFGIAASSSAELQAVADHSQLMIPGEYLKGSPLRFCRFLGRHLLSLLGSGAYRVCPLSVSYETA